MPGRLNPADCGTATFGIRRPNCFGLSVRAHSEQKRKRLPASCSSGRIACFAVQPARRFVPPLGVAGWQSSPGAHRAGRTWDARPVPECSQRRARRPYDVPEGALADRDVVNCVELKSRKAAFIPP